MIIVTGHRKLGTGRLEVSAAAEVSAATTELAAASKVSAAAAVTAAANGAAPTAEVAAATGIATAAAEVATRVTAGVVVVAEVAAIVDRFGAATADSSAPIVAAVRGRGVAAEELVVHPHAGRGAEQAAEEAREEPAAAAIAGTAAVVPAAAPAGKRTDDTSDDPDAEQDADRQANEAADAPTPATSATAPVVRDRLILAPSVAGCSPLAQRRRNVPGGVIHGRDQALVAEFLFLVGGPLFLARLTCLAQLGKQALANLLAVVGAEELAHRVADDHRHIARAPVDGNHDPLLAGGLTFGPIFPKGLFLALSLGLAQALLIGLREFLVRLQVDFAFDEPLRARDEL